MTERVLKPRFSVGQVVLAEVFLDNACGMLYNVVARVLKCHLIDQVVPQTAKQKKWSIYAYHLKNMATGSTGIGIDDKMQPHSHKLHDWEPKESK